jgi:hypothetical protein
MVINLLIGNLPWCITNNYDSNFLITYLAFNFIDIDNLCGPWGKKNEKKKTKQKTWQLFFKKSNNQSK